MRDYVTISFEEDAWDDDTVTEVHERVDDDKEWTLTAEQLQMFVTYGISLPHPKVAEVARLLAAMGE